MTRTQIPRPPCGVTATANRCAPLIKGCSVVLIVVGLALMLRRLPVGPVLERLQGWIAGLGVWGLLVFGLLYAAASLLLVPASALTLAAGALFGLTLGTLVVSLASTTSAGLAFLFARYFARQRITRKIRHYPRFDALDRAVGEGGWKIVALLRLSPAVPFTLQNYLYGLTGIRFWPYLLTSWLAMLPGTFLYIYLGHLGRAGVEAASGELVRSPAEWVMMGVGLLATAAATVYITRLARKALRQRAGTIEEVAVEPTTVPGWPWGATLLAAVALAILTAAAFVQFRPKVLNALFGDQLNLPTYFLLCCWYQEPVKRESNLMQTSRTQNGANEVAILARVLGKEDGQLYSARGNLTRWRAGCVS
ncbi:MAG: TVP38/TMEM64 family protein, partial [Gemmataceae bacterium]